MTCSQGLLAAAQKGPASPPTSCRPWLVLLQGHCHFSARCLSLLLPHPVPCDVSPREALGRDHIILRCPPELSPMFAQRGHSHAFGACAPGPSRPDQPAQSHLDGTTAPPAPSSWLRGFLSISRDPPLACVRARGETESSLGPALIPVWKTKISLWPQVHMEQRAPGADGPRGLWPCLLLAGGLGRGTGPPGLSFLTSCRGGLRTGRW